MGGGSETSRTSLQDRLEKSAAPYRRARHIKHGPGEKIPADKRTDLILQLKII